MVTNKINGFFNLFNLFKNNKKYTAIIFIFHLYAKSVILIFIIQINYYKTEEKLIKTVN
jgi:hypothetical protein